jgi:hypothetical protein
MDLVEANRQREAERRKQRNQRRVLAVLVAVASVFAMTHGKNVTNVIIES